VIKVPSAQEIMAAYPAKPRAAGVSGKVELDCLIDSTGILSGCTVKSESPPNQGFGTAALALAPDFAAKSITPPVALQSVLQPVLQTITVNFDPDPQKIAALNAPARAEAVDAHGDPIDWVRRPTADELSDAYPAQALKTRATGSAIIDCDVQLDGSLSRCVVESEEPNGLGFGEAAVKMSANFRMTAGAPDFRGARPRVRVPVSFNPGDAGGGSGTWVRQPSTEELAAAYPVVARNKKIEGWATLACEVKSDGALSGCVVGSEEPEGMGFGEAALGLAPSFLMPPGTPDAFGKRPAVSVPLHFVPPGS
jgi:TonB family protein